MLRVLLIAVFATFMISDQLVAQGQSSRRGRFLQRLRDDIFGNSKPAPSTKQNEQTGRAPTPIGSNSGSNVLNPSSRSTGRSTTGRIGAQKRGFGFSIAVNDKDQLYVSNVEPNGNAAEAGIRRGDRVLEIGGIEAKGVEEFNEIAKIMQQGDQMEFKTSRKGQNKKVMVQYGNVPESKQNQISSSSNKLKSDSESSPTKRFDFAPPNQNARSVLDSPIPLRHPRSIQPVNSERRQFNQQQPVRQRLTDQSNGQQVQMLQQTIANQNQQIQLLQREIQQLRRAVHSR